MPAAGDFHTSITSVHTCRSMAWSSNTQTNTGDETLECIPTVGIDWLDWQSSANAIMFASTSLASCSAGILENISGLCSVTNLTANNSIASRQPGSDYRQHPKAPSHIIKCRGPHALHALLEKGVLLCSNSTIQPFGLSTIAVHSMSEHGSA